MPRLYSERRMKIELQQKTALYKRLCSADKKRQTEIQPKSETPLPCAVPKAATVQL